MFNNIISVSSFVSSLREMIEGSFSFVAIEGEISGYYVAGSGHAYFDLKDSSSSIRCTIFRNQRATVKAELKDGDKITIWGRASIYEKSGMLTFIVSYVRQAGIGDDALKLAILKEKLHKEGLFDEKHKKKLPEFVTHIGVVTSRNGAAIHDIIKVARNRFPGIKITLYPSMVQGTTAEKTIIQGIEKLSDKNEIDVIIVGRGGGSKEDLSVFNSENIARAVIASGKPVVAAVGHEIDRTIIDLAASYTVSTPSAAAELVTPDKSRLLEIIEKDEKALKYYFRTIFEQLTMKLDMLEARIPSVTEWFNRKNQTITYLENNIENNIRKILSEHKTSLALAESDIEKHNPLAPLGKGYVLVYDNETVVIKGATVKQESELKIVFEDGELFVTADKFKKNS